MASFRGVHGSYEPDDQHPFAYGRISVLLRATDSAGRAVCLKVFRDAPAGLRGRDGRVDFARELKAQSQLRHANILPILDYGESAGDAAGPFIVYPLCTGGNLRERFTGKNHMPVAEGLAIIEQVGRAVDFAHSSGFIHGDIKPENVLFEVPGGVALLADFGMSRYFPHVELVGSERRHNPKEMVEETIGGSSAYLSPEQVDENTQSPSSDIYSLGIMSYELLTGTLPFDTDMPIFRQMQAKVAGDLDRPAEANPNLPLAVQRALTFALEANPERRPSTALDFCRALRGELEPPNGDGSPEDQVEGRAHLDRGRTAHEAAKGAATKSISKRKKASSSQRVKLTSIIVAAVVAVVTAFIKVLPVLLK